MIDKTNELFKLPNIDIRAELIFLFIDEINKFENNIVFVFDDFHLIENSSIHKGIHFFIKYLPNNFKLVFTSRTELPFSVEKYRSIMICLGSVLALFMANTIVRPINKLKKCMEAAGKGDLTVYCDINSKYEIGVLSNSFNYMIKENKRLLEEAIQYDKAHKNK